jgi:hypothetical protein
VLFNFFLIHLKYVSSENGFSTLKDFEEIMFASKLLDQKHVIIF